MRDPVDVPQPGAGVLREQGQQGLPVGAHQRAAGVRPPQVPGQHHRIAADAYQRAGLDLQAQRAGQRADGLQAPRRRAGQHPPDRQAAEPGHQLLCLYPTQVAQHPPPVRAGPRLPVAGVGVP